MAANKRLFIIPCIFLFPLSLLFSCNENVVIQGYYHWPYCGGKIPDSSEIGGRYEALAHHSFQLQHEKQPYKRITLNAQGIWQGRLAHTKCSLLDEDKLLSYEDLKRKYPLPEFNGHVEQSPYRYLDEKAWEQWRAQVDFEAVIIDRDTLHFVVHRSCFVGTNPIIEYVGPKPR